jgi:hypothetical protein
MSLKSLKMPHITGKASHHFKKGLNFSENAFKKKISLKISLKCHEFLKTKKHRILKKKPRGNCIIASPPLHKQH